MTALTSWLTSTLPPESGPSLQWLAANLSLVTPLAVLLLALGLWVLLRLSEAFG